MDSTPSTCNTVVEGQNSRDVSPSRSDSKVEKETLYDNVNVQGGTDNKDTDVITSDSLLAAQAQGDGTVEVVEVQKDNGKKEHWLEKTEMTLPKNNLPVVFTGLMLTVFLAALDQTICSTALPTISVDLHMSATDYSWVGSAYLLASTAVIPLYGRMSDLVGRKRLLYLAISIFLFGSAMCGAAQSPTWLNVCRAVQGLGGGGIMSLANILIGDLVSLKDRGTYSGMFGFVWGFASVVGPLLGGIISQHTTWRWIFFLNLPIGGAAFVVLFFSLNLNPHERKSAKQHLRQFDIFGYILILTAIIIFLLGFTFAETDGFQSPKAIACIVIGVIMFPIFTAFEFWLEKHNSDVKPIVPPRIFRTRTTALILVGVACHAIAFFATAYYLPLYYQAITGSTATISALQMLPFSFLSAIVSAASGYLVSYLGRYRPILWFSFGLFTLGMGLMIMLDADTPKSLQEIYPALAGLGLGPLFQTPMVAMTAAMPPAQMATSVATYALVRSAAGTVGITVAGSIFNSGVHSRLKNIPGYSDTSTANLKNIIHLEPPSLAYEVVHAYGDALRLVWIVLTPIVGVGFLCSLGVKGYSLNRRIIQNPGKIKESSKDVEKQTPIQQEEQEEQKEKEEKEEQEEEGKSSHDTKQNYSSTNAPALSTLEKDPASKESSEA